MTDGFKTFPDWGVQPARLPAPDSDLTEVAARLGSLSTYRRTGRVLFQSRFFNLTGWNTFGDPNNFCRTTWSFFGGASAVQYRPNAGFTSMRRIGPWMPTLGGEFMLLPEFPVGVNSTIFQFRMFAKRDLQMQEYRLWVYLHSRELFVATVGGGGMTKILDLDYSTGLINETWLNIKMSISPETGRYGWLLYNDQEFYIGNLAPPVSAVGPMTHVELLLGTQTITHNQPTWMNIDNFILTTNEPV